MRGNEAAGTSEQGSETRKDFLERKLILTFLERTGSRAFQEEPRSPLPTPSSSIS